MRPIRRRGCLAKLAGAPAETPPAAIAQAAPRMRAASLLRFMNSSSSGGWDDERGDCACRKLVGERLRAHLDVEFLGTVPMRRRGERDREEQDRAHELH